MPYLKLEQFHLRYAPVPAWLISFWIRHHAVNANLPNGLTAIRVNDCMEALLVLAVVAHDPAPLLIRTVP